MREIVHWIEAPLITGVVVLLMADAIDHRIAQVQIRRGHVDLRAQRLFAIGKFPRPHALEECEILLRRPAPAGAFLTGLLRHTTVFLPLVWLQLTYIRLAVLNQLHRVAIQLLKIIRGKKSFLRKHRIRPAIDQPLHILGDRIDILRVLLHRIGVIKAQIADAVILQRDAEIQADGFRVAEMQIPIGLRRKPRDHAGIFPHRQIRLHAIADEILQPLVTLSLIHARCICGKSSTWSIVLRRCLCPPQPKIHHHERQNQRCRCESQKCLKNIHAQDSLHPSFNQRYNQQAQ